MNQFELNQIRSKLRRLDLDDQFIERYIDKLIRNKEPFVTASKAIDRWDKKDSGQFVLQALACGLIAALAGCLLYTSPSPRDKRQSRMPSSA